MFFDIKINGNCVYHRNCGIAGNPGCISTSWVCAAWPYTGMCGIHGTDDDISHTGLADDWCDPCNSSRKQSCDILWYRFDNTYEEYRIWSGRVCRIMIIENDFVSRWHKVKIMKCIQYGKRNKKSLQKFCGDFLYPSI